MNDDNPYRSMPRTAFWSRAVSTQWNPRDLRQAREPLIRANDAIMSAGSCFAANIVPYLHKAGFNYLKTEEIVSFGEGPSVDRFGYGRYSAAYGNIYTPRQLVQLLRRALGEFKPIEDRWRIDQAIIDPFRPGLPFAAENDSEFDMLTSRHLANTLAAFRASDVFIFTLGLTECWVSGLDGAAFPACPGTVAGSFDPERHAFTNFSASDIVADIDAFVQELRQINPKVRIVLTVSPVPLAATATGQHVVVANAYSKAVLRVACEEAVHRHPEMTYFPAYEIVVSAKNAMFFEDDRRSVNTAGIETVVDVLLSHCETPCPRKTSDVSDEPEVALLSQMLASHECEEMMADHRGRPIE